MNEKRLVATNETGLAEATQRARNYIHNALSESTHKAHRIDWGQFETWCRRARLRALPATTETVVLWLADVADGYKPSTLERKLASISKAHQFAGHESPTRAPEVRTCLKGIRRSKRKSGASVAPQKKAPILAKHLRAMMEFLPDTLQGKRDKAILLIGYAGGFRRSELSALEVRDLDFKPQGVVLRLRFSKTNQDGAEDEMKEICYGMNAVTCPVRALKEWLEAATIEDGPILRPITRHDTPRSTALSGSAINKIVKKYAAKVGLDVSEIGAHSLRAGFVTDQYNAGTPTPAIMGQTGHKCERVLNGYYRKAKQFERNLTAAAGL